jgi:serine/threonine-protein kinase mTOR
MNQMMFEILNKLLNIAVSDHDAELRETMLGSLNSKFDVYLKLKPNLQNLILALSDCNDEVQRRAIIILKRLMVWNSGDIIPVLQNTLYRIIRVLSIRSSDSEKEILQNLKLLKCFINHAPKLIHNHRDLMFKFLLGTLNNKKTTQNMSAEIFSTLSSLVSISKTATIKYFDTLMQLTMDSLEDMAFTKKRLEAIKCMSNIIRTSGLVVFVNYKYLNLIQLIFTLFQIEANVEARYELMKLMGVLGAIDFFDLFKLEGSKGLTDVTQNHQEIMNTITSNHKGKFYFQSKCWALMLRRGIKLAIPRRPKRCAAKRFPAEHNKSKPVLGQEHR